MSGDIPCATSDAQSVRTTSGALGQFGKVHPKQPGIVLTLSDCSITHLMVSKNYHVKISLNIEFLN